MFALVDGNSFYASCEQVFDPDAARRPVVVLSNNDGVVVAATRDLKDAGVELFKPYFQIKDQLAGRNVRVFSSNYTLYDDMQRRLVSIYRTHAEDVEVYSIDEAFLALGRTLASIKAGDAEDFRQHLLGQGKAENTVRRSIGRARQFFNDAKKRDLIRANPFEGMAAAVRPNAERFHFVSREDADKVLDACPDAQWRLIFALARFGGLRCPSEVLALTWNDVNWERNRIRIPSPKTEHHEGGASRTIPLFPELKPHLLAAFEEAQEGEQFVITSYRQANANLRTQLHRIIRRAGLEPWPKTFQNLRSTRETELAEKYAMHVVCKWIGNSEPVAAAHYLQLTDEHFERAVNE